MTTEQLNWWLKLMAKKPWNALRMAFRIIWLSDLTGRHIKSLPIETNTKKALPDTVLGADEINVGTCASGTGWAAFLRGSNI